MLPTWTVAPTDEAAAIVEIKRALRDRIESSGRTVAEVMAVVEAAIAAEVADIQAANEATGTAWPQVEFEALAERGLSVEERELVRRRGCLVVRGHFAHDQALTWDGELADYVEQNRFVERYRGAGDTFFGTGATPAIYPIYWSRPQMEARQSDRMAVVQRTLNSMWHDSGGLSFDADRSVFYPDRVRRRPAGTSSNGLAPHVDAGTLDLWMKAEYQQAFRHVFDGSIESFDPWDANGRTDGDQFLGSTMTSVFRTFQGWTALSDMQADQGVLEAIVIPGAIAYLLLRPLLDDVEPEDMCGVSVGQSFWVTPEWHGPLLDGLSRIPDVRAGDSVWWHGDLVHGVAPVEDQQGWGNVMYIPAAPWCPRNERYAASLGPAFLSGRSPDDFPDEHYEVDWAGRFGADELNDFGRESLGL
ncbi:MAG: YbiU family protein [Actinomycetota bacterium]